MDKAKWHGIFEMIGFFASLMVVVLAFVVLIDHESTPQLIGLAAGSFGAGASLTNLIRNRTAGRSRNKK